MWHNWEMRTHGADREPHCRRQKALEILQEGKSVGEFVAKKDVAIRSPSEWLREQRQPRHASATPSGNPAFLSKEQIRKLEQKTLHLGPSVGSRTRASYRSTVAIVLLALLAACGTPTPIPQTMSPVASSAPRLSQTHTPPSPLTNFPSSTPITKALTNVPDLHGTFGAPVTFATHAEFDGYGFQWGPSDGDLGAIPVGNGDYIFYGSGGSKSSCTDAPKTHNAEGVFAFSGTLDQVTSGNGCGRLFGFGDAPLGWVFDRDYAGGGQVVRFAANGKRGWLMSFHSEYQWKNQANPPSYLCKVGNTNSQVPCFYSTVGLAVSTDNGKTFKVVGEIAEPSQPLSAFETGAGYMDVGDGSLVVADANGRHLDNPPADPLAAYFYLFFEDRSPGLPGACASTDCLAVARASYADVIAAAFSGDPHRVAEVFRKYDATPPDPWTQPATSDTSDLTGTAGKFSPLWTDEGAYDPVVLYDKSFDVYLAVYLFADGFKVRASRDMLHWSKPINAGYYAPGHELFYPTLIGETGDPTIGGTAPRIYFSSFPTGKFPDYTTAVFESIPLMLSLGR